MHPDQSTPASHRYAASDSQSATPRAPEQDLDSDAIPPDRDAAPAATEVPEGARVAEAGHGYVGRMMDDDLKAHPRVLDGDEAVAPTTPEDD